MRNRLIAAWMVALGTLAFTAAPVLAMGKSPSQKSKSKKSTSVSTPSKGKSSQYPTTTPRSSGSKTRY